MEKIKIIFFGCLIILISCKSKEKGNVKYKKGSFVKAHVDFSLKDTMKLDEKQNVEIRFYHPLKTINERDRDFKLVDACIIFASKERLLRLKNQFDEKCDTIFAPRVKINDTALFSFAYTPSALGKNYIYAKIEEKNYFKVHKDSTRLISFEYFIEEEFFVEP